MKTTIDNSQYSNCKVCNGTGSIQMINLPYPRQICNQCNGIGKWKDSHFIHVFEKDGIKYAIDSDHAGS